MSRLTPACLLTVLFALPAAANERHFTFSHESATLPAGAVEIEPWTTLRMGRDAYFLGIDHRLEFELGITDRLMGALYLNFGSETARDGAQLASSFQSKGASAELKFKLTDANADAIGSALYLEVTAAPTEMEVEGKLLLDKRLGSVHLVGNVIYEHGWEHVGYWNDEHKLGLSLGGTYFVTDHFTLGAEAFGQGIIEAPDEHGRPELEHGAVFLGPVVGLSAANWWLTTSVTPQIVGFGEALSATGAARDLEDFHAVQARMLLGMHY